MMFKNKFLLIGLALGLIVTLGVIFINKPTTQTLSEEETVREFLRALEQWDRNKVTNMLRTEYNGLDLSQRRGWMVDYDYKNFASFMFNRLGQNWSEEVDIAKDQFSVTVSYIHEEQEYVYRFKVTEQDGVWLIDMNVNLMIYIVNDTTHW